jgi:hypothetical protein
MTWTDLIALEPRLADLERQAGMLYRKKQRNHYAWESVKVRLSPLVGNRVRQPALRTREAFAVALDHLRARLEHG